MERIPPDGRSSCSRAENALDLLRPSVIILHSVPTHGLIAGQTITKMELQLDYFRFFSSHIYLIIY